MRFEPRRALAAASALLVVAGGCGTSHTRPTTATVTATATATATTPTPKDQPLHVVRPHDNAIQHAHRVGSQLLATLTVRGTASPQATVYVTANCTGTGCEQIANTGDGHWAARVQVTAPLRHPKLDVAIGYADPASGQPSLLLHVKLKEHKTAHHHHTTPQPTDTTPTVPTATVPATTPSGPRPLVMIGDSLAVGTKAALAADLPDFDVRTDARVGRTLAQGMALLATMPTPDPRTILAFSLFTNDEPTNLTALGLDVRFSVQRLGAHGCAIWATIHRPPVNGVTYAAANKALLSLAASPELRGKLLVVPWASAVAHDPTLLAKDGVHATPAGYAKRAELYAEAARACER